MIQAQKNFIDALRIQRNENGSIYMYADLDGFRYGQAYKKQEKNTISNFVRFYLPMYLKDLENNN